MNGKGRVFVKQKGWALALLLALSLCGCGQAGSDEAGRLALEVRTAYLNAAEVAASVAMTADYGTRVYDYKLDARWLQSGETTLTVREPSLIAGLTAVVREGETALEYDGARMETGPLWPDGMAPIDAVPYLMECIRTGFMAECGLTEEADGTRTLTIRCREPELQPGEGAECLLTFGAEDFALRRAELSRDGATVLFCTFGEFTLTGGSKEN